MCHPPSGNVNDFILHMDNTLRSIQKICKNVVLGDFNIDMLSNSYAARNLTQWLAMVAQTLLMYLHIELEKKKVL